jgi:hypothetical protein
MNVTPWGFEHTYPYMDSQDYTALGRPKRSFGDGIEFGMVEYKVIKKEVKFLKF